MIPVKKLEPFRSFCMTLGELPSAYVDSLTYVELLTWLCNYLEKTVIPTVNNNGEAVEELQRLFIELKEYVENYLESPEFIEQIDTKLDEMATDGTFDAIINTNITGTLSNLDTTDKSNLVSAINEVNTKVATAESHIGTLANLTTSSKDNTVSAINEVNSNVGTLSNLTTTVQTDIVSAVNEINSVNEYSSTEQVVGTWVNDSIIYRKAFTFTEWTGLGYDTGITDIQDLINAVVVLKNTESGQWLKLAFVSGGDYGFYVKKTSTTYKVFIANDSVYTADSVNVILEYTKPII